MKCSPYSLSAFPPIVQATLMFSRRNDFLLHLRARILPAVGVPRKFPSLLIAAILFLGWSTGADAELRILRAEGPAAAQYPTGTRLPDNHRFALQSGDKIVVLRSGGGRLVLQGPSVGTAEVLALETRRADRNRARMGAIR